MGIESVKKYFEPVSILDIGANVGQFYNDAKLLFPNAYFYLIEGNDNCEVGLAGLEVDYSIALLSDIEKEVDFYIRKYEPRCTGNSIYRENTSFFDDDQIIIERKKTITLNKLLNDKFFDLIKIDVQGSEIDIVKGGLEIFKNAKGVLMEVSLVEYNKNAPTQDFVINFMSELGFKEAERIGNVTHPITHELIQQDVLFLNKNIK